MNKPQKDTFVITVDEELDDETFDEDEDEDEESEEEYLAGGREIFLSAASNPAMLNYLESLKKDVESSGILAKYIDDDSATVSFQYEWVYSPEPYQVTGIGALIVRITSSAHTKADMNKLRLFDAFLKGKLDTELRSVEEKLWYNIYGFLGDSLFYINGEKCEANYGISRARSVQSS